MSIKFTKMHGTGNDFIMIDQFETEHRELTTEEVGAACNRRFGIGADGLIILRNHDSLDFEMVYYNADGNLSSMCGNGGRCAVQMAYDHRYIDEHSSFLAPDGIHHALVQDGSISLGMSDVSDYACANGIYLLNTGSPHYVVFVDDVDQIDVKEEGAKIRYSDTYKSQGINVNFVQLLSENQIKIRTYERGVEDETFSCGTGVTAAAIACYLKTGIDKKDWLIKTRGGDLAVIFEVNNDSFTNINLIGPAETVFVGKFPVAPLL